MIENSPQAFDAYADGYESTLNAALSVTGETSDYFAHARVQWLTQRLEKLGHQPKHGLDFGCGTGGAIPFLLQSLNLESLHGVDVSEESLAVARRRHDCAINEERRPSRRQLSTSRRRRQRSPRRPSRRRGQDTAITFGLPEDMPGQRYDLAFTNGVFHHIPPDQRHEALGQIARSLAPGGLLAFWENNPLNPGTRWLMRRAPFDRDAMPLSSRQSRRLLRESGFHVLRTDFVFFFPRCLAWLRWMEPRLKRIPLGGQYMILAQTKHG